MRSTEPGGSASGAENARNTTAGVTYLNDYLFIVCDGLLANTLSAARTIIGNNGSAEYTRVRSAVSLQQREASTEDGGGT
jgi:hypothetical protein